MSNKPIPYNFIRGGKGQEQRTPVEAPNTLKSVALARIMDLVSEGEIVGLVDGMRSIYLDETPIMNADESLNFKNIIVDFRYGTQTQSYIPGYPSVENELGIGVELTDDTPYVRAFSNLNLSAVRVRLSVQALSKTNKKNGDINGYKVEYAIDVATNGGPYVTALTSAFDGKTMSKYERAHRINLPKQTSGSGWQIRVRRITANADGSEIQDKTFVESMTEVIDAKLRYPNSAVVGIVLDAQQFQSIPSRGYDMKGRIIRVPSNYDPITRAYDGIWDGTFQPAWTDNPAWIYYDLVTHPRYGLGHLISDSQINKWALYKIAQYCDGYVDNGLSKRAVVTTGSTSLAVTVTGTVHKIVRTTGSFVTDGFLVGDFVTTSGFSNAVNNGDFEVAAVTALEMTLQPRAAMIAEAAAGSRQVDLRKPMEPRFTCNLFLQSQAEAFKVLSDLATVFRGMAFWANGEIHAVCDMPEEPAFTYTPSNVVAGKFVYQGSARKTRATIALISWNDLLDFGRQKIEYVEDADGIARYGIQQVELTALGCTSQGQAQRMGRYALLTGQYETDSVTFSVGLEGTIVAPGKVIRIADPLRAGVRMGGRLVSGTTTVVTVDADTVANVADTFTIIRPSDGVSETRAISVVDPNLRTFTVSPAFSEAPMVGSVWAIDRTIVNTQRYRVLSVSENEDMSYSITAVRHNESKFDAVDLGTKIVVPPVSIIPSQFQVPPENVIITSYPTAGAVIAMTYATIQWDQAATAISYEVEYQRENGPWIGLGRTTNTCVDIPGAGPGIYTARVRAINAIGIMSQPAESTPTTVSDQTLRPSFVGALNNVFIQALELTINIDASADGVIQTFVQSAEPTTGMADGDAWVDTNDGNAYYRYDEGLTDWVAAPDDILISAILTASEVATTSDGLVTTFFQMTTPAGDHELGDLWWNTLTEELYRWNGFNWTQNFGDFTLAQLGGNGHNILWDEYSRFNGPLPTITGPSNGTVTRDTGQFFFSTASLKMVSAGTGQYFYFGNSKDIPITVGRSYIFSMYVRSSQASAVLKATIDDGTNTSVATMTAASATPNTWTRVWGTFSALGFTDNVVKLKIENHNASGVTTYIDGIMIEPTIGTLGEPSAFASGIAGRLALQGILAAAEAQATADGKIDAYFQDEMPVGGAYGDIWFDTNDGNLQYVHDGITWVIAADTRIGDAILDAAGAQATADAKVRTFYSTTEPNPVAPEPPLAIGDLWLETDNGNRLRRWNGLAWTDVASASVIETLDIETGEVTINCLYSDQFVLLMTENVTDVLFTNIPESKTVIIEVRQDNTGGRTITWPANIQYVNGTPLVLTPNPGSVTMVGLMTNNFGLTWSLVATQAVPFEGTPMTIDATPNPAYDSDTVGTGSPANPSIVVVADADEGVAPYTYEWTRVDTTGGTDFGCSTPNDETTTFSRTSSVTSSITQTWRCTVNDSAGQQAHIDVPVTLDTINSTVSLGGSITPSPAVESAAPGEVLEATVTMTPTGGTAPYTYLWSRVASGANGDTGGPDFYHGSLTAATVTFGRASGTLRRTRMQNWKCVATDVGGNTAQATVAIYLTTEGDISYL